VQIVQQTASGNIDQLCSYSVTQRQSQNITLWNQSAHNYLQLLRNSQITIY